ncbi:MAG: hypothetical protein M3O15_00575, partial [Acidobacteriota bacterium]|nr:hypothetical protein [Acidobacteriota bacterium]
LEVLLVRPGQGVWGITVGDGGQNDEDGASDGHLQFSLDHLRPVARSASPPSRIAVQDLLIVVDPNRMEISLVRPGAGH